MFSSAKVKAGQKLGLIVIDIVAMATSGALASLLLTGSVQSGLMAISIFIALFNILLLFITKFYR